MSMTVMASFRTTPENKARVEALAKKTKRSASYYYNQMLDEYLEDLEDLQDAILVAENIKDGKEKTISLEYLKKEFGL